MRFNTSSMDGCRSGFWIFVFTMIQRLTDINGPVEFNLKPYRDNPFSRHPDLGALAMGAVASWSKVESRMLGLFVVLLGGRTTLAADIYLSLEGEGPKNRVVTTAANSLDTSRRELFDAIMDIASTNAKVRHKIAHGEWMDSRHLSDAMLLTDQLTAYRRKNLAEHTFIYRAKDFQDIIDANGRLCDYLHSLNIIVRRTPSPEAEQLSQRLSLEPEIRERLDRRKARRDRANNAAPPPPPPV